MSEETAALTIHIPVRVVKEIGKFIPNTSYTCITDYIEKKICLLFPAKKVYSESEEKAIRDRLRKLGYIE